MNRNNKKQQITTNFIPGLDLTKIEYLSIACSAQVIRGEDKGKL